VKVAAAIASKPDASLPKQTGDWADLMGAYRLFNNPAVQPPDIQEPHCQRTRERCRGLPVVLCVQDTSTLDYTRFKSKKGLGPIDRQNGQGLLQHTVLAVVPGCGRLLGVLNQRWQIRIAAPEGETVKQRRARWRESLFWAEGIEAVGKPPPMAGTRFISVADRGADCFETFEACMKMDHGWILRAQHDRWVQDRSDHLWSFMGSRAILKTIKVKVPARAAKRTTNRGLGGKRRAARTARVEIRAAAGVQLDPPHGQRRTHPCPQTMNVVYAREIDPPAGVTEPIDWMLLTSEPVNSIRSALRVIAWYRCRWVIEEYHKVQKSGCRLEDSQLQDVDALRRLAAVVGVCAVRMLWLRDLAGRGLELASSNLLPGQQMAATPAASSARAATTTTTTTTTTTSPADDPKMLSSLIPPLWIAIVTRLAKGSGKLTPRQFWQTIARRGGWLARKHDGRPGWKALWDGWHDVALLVEGAALIGGG
jgi:hypothetical protein